MFQLALLAFEQRMNVKMITFYVKSLELLVIVTEFPPQPFDKPLKRKTIINDINCADTNLLKSFSYRVIIHRSSTPQNSVEESI